MVANFLILILVFAGVGAYFMTPAERTRLFAVAAALLGQVRDTVALGGVQGHPFYDALRARNTRVIATPVLVVMSTAVFARAGVVDLFVSAVCLWQIGLILERLLGRLAFTTIYVASGLAAGVASLSVSSDAASVGASAPVLGMYGLLLVTSIWSAIRRSNVAIPLNVIKRLAPVAGVFVLYKVIATGLANATDVAALVCGLAGGVVAARDVNERVPQIRRLATAMATVVTVVMLYAMVALRPPLNAVTDVRPEIDRVLALEIRTAGLYEKEVDRFRKGRITAKALAGVIEKTIVPDLQAVAGRLRTLQDVPPEHQPLIVAAETFLKVRHESWRLRAAALNKSDMKGLRNADSQEQASREAFHQLNTMTNLQKVG